MAKIVASAEIGEERVASERYAAIEMIDHFDAWLNLLLRHRRLEDLCDDGEEVVSALESLND